MLKSVERLLEFVGDMNATEINDHIKARLDGIAVSFRIDNEWLDGWNRAVLATVEKIEKEVSERFMELPKDADGVPIRVGDVIKLPNGRSEEVRYMIINGAGWLINEAGWISCKVSHDKPDTWERIIEDAMGRYSDADADALVARCKALAGEGE